MTRTLILVAFLMFSLCTSAQRNLDSLWGVWEDKSKHDTIRAEALTAFAWYSHLSSQPDSAIFYFQIAYDIYKENDSKKGMASMKRALGEASKRKGYFQQSLDYFQSCYDLFDELSNKEKMAESLNNMGQVCIHLHEYSRSLEYFAQGLAIAQETGNQAEIASLTVNIGLLYHTHGNQEMALSYYQSGLTGYEKLYSDAQASNKKSKAANARRNIGRILNNMGRINQELGEYKKAQFFYEYSLKIKEESGATSGIASSYLNLGNNAKEQGEYEKALDFYFKSLEKFEELSNKGGIAYSLIYVGEMHYRAGKEKEGNEYCLRGLKIYEEIPDSVNLASSLNRIGYFLTNLGDYKIASEYFRRGIKIQEEINDEHGLVTSLYNFGRLYYEQENYGKSIYLWERSLELADKLGVISGQKDACKMLYKTYKEINNDSKALQYYERSRIITDGLKYYETTGKLLQVEFEQQRIADSLTVVEDKLRTELAFQDTLSTEKQTRNAFMYSGLGILIIAGGLFARMRYIRRTNRKLEEKNIIIAREKERAEESEKSKDQFFNNISHEFRTPLTLILGPLEEALSKPKADPFRKEHEIMHRSAIRLQGMINELLNLSKLEFGTIKLVTKEENIVEITEAYLQSFESLADQRRINLYFQSDKKKYDVWLDLEKYRQILANLLSNAFKFTDEGGKVTVEIGKMKALPAGEKVFVAGDLSFLSGEIEPEGVMIKIIDTGIGIPEDKLTHIFDRFFQTGDKSFTEQAGTGIGLALTKELVELHHGIIAVESEKDKGTCFTIILRFGTDHFIEDEILIEEVTSENEKDDKDWAIEEDIAGFEIEKELRKMDDRPVVLITEDNPDMQSYIQSQLEANYYILKARDGEEGLATALEKIPDLVISDVMMPRMDGHEMTEKLKTDQRTSHIPVIMLTAKASIDNKIEGLETGADAYLTKPFNARELKVRVKNLIEQRKKLRELFAGELSSGLPITSDSNLPSMDQQFIQKAIEIVLENLTDTDFDVTTFASEIALSRAQLHRKMKALTDKTTSEFIRTIRLNKAAEMLRAKSDTVTQIAYETGFNNLSWFAKAFKEQFGVTPSEYDKSSS